MTMPDDARSPPSQQAAGQVAQQATEQTPGPRRRTRAGLHRLMNVPTAPRPHSVLAVAPDTEYSARDDATVQALQRALIRLERP